jgi:hypothetical protein
MSTVGCRSAVGRVGQAEELEQLGGLDQDALAEADVDGEIG